MSVVVLVTVVGGVAVVRVVVSVSMSVAVVVSVAVSVIVGVIMTAVTVSAAATLTVGVVVLTTKMIVALTRVQNLDLDAVENKGKDCHHEHLGSDDLNWLKETHSSFDEKPHSHDPDGSDRNHGADDLGAMPTIRQMVC